MLIRANMAYCPERRALFQQACVLRQDVLPKELQVIALPKEVSTGSRLDQLTVEVNRILDCLVLDWEYFDALDYLIQEELRQNVAQVATLALLSRETEIDAVFHHEKALLALRSL